MDPYASISELYDWEHDPVEDDAEFYLNLIGEGPVLEVGCGTGRVTGRLAAAGLEVYGIDTSEAMLARARERLKDAHGAHLLQGAVEDVDAATRFNAVIWPLNVLWHLSDAAAQLRALRTTYRLCAPRALVVIDLTNPLGMADRGAAGEARLRFQASRDGETVQGFSSAQDDEGEQSIELTLWYDRVVEGSAVHRTLTTLRLRYVYRSELDLMLKLADFKSTTMYGSYDLEPYSTTSPNLIAVARAG